MKRILLVAALLALVLVPATAATQSSGDLYPQPSGTLSLTSGGPAQPCLALTATSSATVTKTFTGPFANTTATLVKQTLSALLSLGANPMAGTGFTLQGQLTVGGKSSSDLITVPSGTSAPSPLRLAFPIEAVANVTGIATLTLTLTKTGTGPVIVGQSISIFCATQDTRLSSITFEPAAAATSESGSGASSGGLSIPTVFGIAVLAGVVTLIAGALAVAGRSISARRIHLLLGATAGLLIAIAILDLVPEAIELNHDATYTIVIGLLVLFFIRHYAGDHGHDHGGHDAHHDHESSDEHHTHSVATHTASLALVTFFALGFHRFVDGLVLPAAFELNSAVGFAAASAVLIHQFPDGIAAASLFLAAGWNRKKVLIGIAIMAALTPVGSVVGLFLLGQDALVGHLIGLAAATFIFIPLAELLPELRAREHRTPVGIGFGIGYLVAFAIVFIPGLLGIRV